MLPFFRGDTFAIDDTFTDLLFFQVSIIFSGICSAKSLTVEQHNIYFSCILLSLPRNIIFLEHQSSNTEAEGASRS